MSSSSRGNSYAMGAGGGAAGGALSGAAYGAQFGSFLGPIGTLAGALGGAIVGSVIGGALGAATAYIGTQLGQGASKPNRHSSDLITTTTTRATTVALAFGRNRLGGNIIACGYFLRDRLGTKSNGFLTIFRANYVLALCEGVPQTDGPNGYNAHGMAAPNNPKYGLYDTNNPPLGYGGMITFGNIRQGGQLLEDLAYSLPGTTYVRHNYIYTLFQGQNGTAISSLPQVIPQSIDSMPILTKPLHGFVMRPQVPWSNTALLTINTIAGSTPVLPDVNIDAAGWDYTIRRSGTTSETNNQDTAGYAFYDSYTESFYYTVSASVGLATPWGLVQVGRQGTPTRNHTPPPNGVSSVTNAWYIGRHDVLVMQDPSNHTLFYIGYWGIPNTDWEAHHPDPRYSVAITRWHLDEQHGILHTYHVSGSNSYILRWNLLTGRITFTNTNLSVSGDTKGFIYSSDFDAYIVLDGNGLSFIDTQTGLMFLNSSGFSPTGVLNICVSGQLVGAIRTTGLVYLDAYNGNTLPATGFLGSDATGTAAGCFGSVISSHQNAYTGHVTMPVVDTDGNTSLINFIPSIMEDIRDVNANGTSGLGQDPLTDATISGLSSNPEPDFQLFPNDTIAGWVRDWSVRTNDTWNLISLAGNSSLCAAIWAANVDEPNLDSKRWGAGLPAKYFNLGSFESLHWYCVGGVQMQNYDGSYRVAERYKFDMMLTGEVSVAEFNTTHALTCCQGYKYCNGGVMHVGVVKPGQWPVWHFSDRHTNEDKGMTVNYLGRGTGVNRVRVQYRDVLTEYRHEFAEATDDWDIQMRQRVQQATIQAEGVGRYGHAYLLAKAVLDQTRGGRRQTTHKSPFVAWMMVPSDPVEISNVQTGLLRMPAKVIQLKEEEKGETMELICLEHIPSYDALGGVVEGQYGPTPNGSGPSDDGNDGWELQVAISPSIGVNWFGNGPTNFAPGIYQITYVSGSWRPSTLQVTGPATSRYLWNNVVAGFSVVTSTPGSFSGGNYTNTTTQLIPAPGLVVPVPGWPSPDDAQQANWNLTTTFALAEAGPIGIVLPVTILDGMPYEAGYDGAVAGGGYSGDLPANTDGPISGLGQQGQVDQEGDNSDAGPPSPVYRLQYVSSGISQLPGPTIDDLSSSVTITGSANSGLTDKSMQVFTGTAFSVSPVLELKVEDTNDLSPFTLYSFVSLDHTDKTIFGKISDSHGMWLEQCLLQYWPAAGGPSNSPGLPSTLSPPTIGGTAGWTLRFYAGAQQNPQSGVYIGAAPGTLVWEGVLATDSPLGTFENTGAACLLPTTMTVS